MITIWIFEKRGFLSVVAYDPKKDYAKDSPFKEIAKESGTHLLVRARIEEDLDWLKGTVPDLKVETDSGADYAYRAVVSREDYKKALCEAVDEIDYDSHFKEAARDNSPKATGRYDAMMSVWSAMAKLQPIRPWSGMTYGGGGLWGGSSSTGSSSVPTTRFASDDEPYRKGAGPKTGFKAGDRVVGYPGSGEVVAVRMPEKGDTEIVDVRLDKGNRIATFRSNYLSYEEIPEQEESDGDMDTVYDWLRERLGPEKSASISQYPVDDLARLDDNGLELLIRAQETVESGEALTLHELNNLHDEILWESSSDQERMEIFADAGTVPAKYEADAVRLFTTV